MAIAYKIAVLIYVFNDAGQVLLLHRKKDPNRDMYSPIGGKLEQQIGESPYACALRETREEIGIQLTLDDIRLMGIVSERAFSANAGAGTPSVAPPNSADAAAPTHWLMFCFEVTRSLDVAPREFDEGRLEWIDPLILPELSIPKTDREIIWPLVRQYSRMLHPANRKREGFFSVHIDCTDPSTFITTHEHPRRSADAP